MWDTTAVGSYGMLWLLRLIGHQLLLVCLLMLCCVAPSDSAIGPLDLQLKVSLSNTGEEITAREPIMVQIILQNIKNTQLDFTFATTTLAINVRNEKGEVCAHYPPLLPREVQEGLARLWTLAPQEKLAPTYIVSAIYPFDTPGTYKIGAELYTVSDPPQLLTRDETTLTVKPYNNTVLEERCEAIYQSLLPKDKGGLIIQPKTNPLYYVKDDIVLPYLDWFARQWNDVNTFAAMRRLGTERSLRLLTEFQARKDRLGAEARKAMNRPLVIRMSDFADY